MLIPTTSLWLLRRLAPRAIRVHARQGPSHVTVAAYDGVIPPTASAYIDLYDELRNLAKLRMKERREGKQAIAELTSKVRLWVPRVARDIDEVQVGEFGANPSVPDDVIRDTKWLLQQVASRTTPEGEPFEYAEAIKVDLEPALANAEKEWTEAETAQRGYADIRKQMLETGVKLEQDLAAYRRTLRLHIGTTDPDYQKLRVDRARQQDADDDAVGAALPEDIEDEAGDSSTDDPSANAPTGDEAQSA